MYKKSYNNNKKHTGEINGGFKETNDLLRQLYDVTSDVSVSSQTFFVLKKGDQ
jgi:hypothetical protein